MLDEIIVVDTGSIDGTVELASRASIKRLHHKWADDFAAARKAALNGVSCD